MQALLFVKLIKWGGVYSGFGGAGGSDLGSSGTGSGLGVVIYVDNDVADGRFLL